MARSSDDATYALSLRQPWAALVVLGLKTIEIRRWPTDRRGPILIHASSVADDRPEVWRDLPPVARGLAQLRGGLLGRVDLVECLAYENLADFTKDQPKHWNQPDWFEPPVLYGFRFENPTPVPYRPFPGWMRFFRVDGEVEKKKRRKTTRRK